MALRIECIMGRIWLSQASIGATQLVPTPRICVYILKSNFAMGWWLTAWPLRQLFRLSFKFADQKVRRTISNCSSLSFNSE
eukprot:855206-Heterocapsa_arctica.AAC.1